VRFRSVPEHWQSRIIQAAEIQVRLYKRIQPYEDAGTPEEYCSRLLCEEMEQLELEEMAAAVAFEEPGEDYLTFKRRYDEWKAKADEELHERQ
jgi:hypothetical protein